MVFREYLRPILYSVVHVYKIQIANCTCCLSHVTML